MGSESELPVFILGMPRSGTTLVEQTLASHPQVHGAGELKHLGTVVQALPEATGSGPYPDCIMQIDAAARNSTT